MFDRLSDPELYNVAAERVRVRRLQTADARPLAPDGPSLAAMSGRIDALAHQLARTVSRGEYRFGPVVRRSACIEGKQRALYVASPLDDIVLGATAEVLAELLNRQLPDVVYSYRRGRSARSAIRDFLAYLRAHRHSHPDPRTRGLYIARRDVRGYGDAIPSGPDSKLWSMLAEALRTAQIEPTQARMRWLEAAFRPEVQQGADLVRPTLGVPTGSPLQPSACNLYLGPVDRICAAIPGAFYARYGDDMLFAHADPQCALAAMQAMDAAIAELGLELSRDKSVAYYFTGAGRASQYAQFRGISAFDYLGVRCEFRGVLGLKREKLHALLVDVSARLHASVRLLDRKDPQLCAATLCAIVNDTLDPRQPVAHPAAQALREYVDDRGQLRDLDYKLTSLIAQTLSGRRGVRALRFHPARELRDRSGLVSLVRAHDRARRRSA